jgi:DNA polymerase I
MNVVLCANHSGIFYNNNLIPKIELSLKALASHIKGTYQVIGTNIIHSASYPKTLTEISNALASLHKYESITADIETFGLKHYEAGIGSIGFATDQHNGIAFMCDYAALDQPTKIDKNTSIYGENIYKNPNDVDAKYLHALGVRQLLWEFFTSYKGKVIWHNASFDCTVLGYQLFMKGLIDHEGLLAGVEHMTSNIHCTKIISYLATNSCAGNSLGLKDQAHEFAGNYAVDEIKDICKVSPDRLLEYNLVDCLSTWYVFNKNYPKMVQDQQLDIYENLMLPSLSTIVQVQLTGMSLDMDKVNEVSKTLEDIHKAHFDGMNQYQFIKDFEVSLRQSQVDADNLKLKTKVRTIDEVSHIRFNPNSNPQLQELLYDVMGLPVLDFTDTKMPATGGKTIKKLVNHTNNPDYVGFMEHLIGYIKVDKILSAFIPSFKKAPKAEDGYHYLFGSFNIGGTVSGRLSSNNPNMQQIPSGSTYAKLIKKCFIAPKDWLFVGADFASLEDRIDALLTKDPNKLKVYTDGYDGHSLRAFGYFGEQMPDIIDTVESINSIKEKYDPLRSDSKAPTFALTYGGTYKTMMTNLGWDEDKSRMVEENYKKLYAVSMTYKKQRIEQCSIDGYATVAFGLRVRTPILHKVLMGSSVTPYAAEAEGRTVGNAMGQSYGLLNNRACNWIMKRVRKSKYRLDIVPCAQIHDAIYFRVRDNIPALKFLNDLVGEAMSWQDLPEIHHQAVGLSGELDVFYPTWADPFTLKNNISEEEILKTTLTELNKRQSK